MTNNNIRLISLPMIVRNSEDDTKELEITPYEVMLSTMLLSNKFGGASRVTIGMLEQLYSLSKRQTDIFRDTLEQVQAKGLVDITMYGRTLNKHTLLEVQENIGDQYLTIDYSLIERILLSDNRIDTKANMIYVLVVLQSRAGYRDFTRGNGQKGYSFPSLNSLELDTGISRPAILNSIELLEELDIVRVVRQGKYISVNRDGEEVVKDYNNVYIVNHTNYTDEDIALLEEEIQQELNIVHSQAQSDKIFSHYISSKSGDDYNSNRPADKETQHEVTIYDDYYILRGRDKDTRKPSDIAKRLSDKEIEEAKRVGRQVIYKEDGTTEIAF